MPRISAAVESWEPRQETVPIHAWIHPWLPYLSSQLEGVYPTIRHKLTRALAAWHPSDGSAALLLKPWQRVFTAGDWDALLQRSIVPQLGYALQVGGGWQDSWIECVHWQHCFVCVVIKQQKLEKVEHADLPVAVLGTPCFDL
jgi:hypothetical protein